MATKVGWCFSAPDSVGDHGRLAAILHFRYMTLIAKRSIGMNRKDIYFAKNLLQIFKEQSAEPQNHGQWPLEQLCV